MGRLQKSPARTYLSWVLPKLVWVALAVLVLWLIGVPIARQLGLVQETVTVPGSASESRIPSPAGELQIFDSGSASGVPESAGDAQAPDSARELQNPDSASPSQVREVEPRTYEIVTILGKDAISAILEPRFNTVEEAAANMRDEELVLGVSLNGDHRAYSLNLLSRHEIANDVVGGQPIAVTW